MPSSTAAARSAASLLIAVARSCSGTSCVSPCGPPRARSASASARLTVVVPVDSDPTTTTRRANHARTGGARSSQCATGSARTAVPLTGAMPRPASTGTATAPSRRAELVAVVLRAEDRGHGLVGDRGEARPEDGFVEVPDRRVGEVDRVVVDHAVEPHVPFRRVHLAQPRQPVGVRDRLDLVGEHEHRDPLAARRRRADQQVVPRVRWVELPDHEPVRRHARSPSIRAMASVTTVGRGLGGLHRGRQALGPSLVEAVLGGAGAGQRDAEDEQRRTPRCRRRPPSRRAGSRSRSGSARSRAPTTGRALVGLVATTSAAGWSAAASRPRTLPSKVAWLIGTSVRAHGVGVVRARSAAASRARSPATAGHAVAASCTRRRSPSVRRTSRARSAGE